MLPSNASKGAFTTAPVLTLPDSLQQFVVEVDASGMGIGVILPQRFERDNKLSLGDFHLQRGITMSETGNFYPGGMAALSGRIIKTLSICGQLKD